MQDMADGDYTEGKGEVSEASIIVEDQQSLSFTSSHLDSVAILEVTVTNTSASHALNNAKDQKAVVHKPPPPQPPSQIIENEDGGEQTKLVVEDVDMITVEDGDNMVEVHKSVVDQYRHRTHYYGPLRAVLERVKMQFGGQETEVVRAKLLQVQLKDSSGQDLKWEDLVQTMQKIPGIIPPCQPPPSVHKEVEVNPSDCHKVINGDQAVQLTLSDSENLIVTKKAIDQYRKLSSQVSKPLTVQREKMFKVEGEESAPVAVVRVNPRENSAPAEISNLIKTEDEAPKPKRGRPRGRGRGVGGGIGVGTRGRRKQQPKFLSDYTALPQTLKMNDEFEECDDSEEVKMSELESGSISMYGFEGGMIVKTSPSYNASLTDLNMESASHINELEDFPLQLQSTPVDLNSKLTPQRIWKYLTEYASEDNRVQGLITQFNNESWLEVKRMSDFFHIDGEVISDVSFKAVYRNDHTPVMYFLRGFSRLLHRGELNTAGEVNHLFRCLSSNRKLCLGLKPSPYQPHIETSEKVRAFFKQTGHIVSTPFEGLYSSACRGIVTISGSPSAVTFVRGNKSILGVYALCNACAGLGKRLNHHIKTTTTTTTTRVSSKNCAADEKILEEKYSRQFLRQPIKSKGTPLSSSDIHKIFTQSVPEVLASGTTHDLPQNGEDETYRGNQRKARRRDVEEGEEEEEMPRPSVGVSEEEFLRMVDLRPPNPGVMARSLVKRCNVCQFRAPTMLSLLVHMQGHMGTLKERCGDCKVQLSSKDALETHKKQMHSERSPMCTFCHLDFTTKDQLFDHMNKHRDHLPFECPYCKHKLTNMDAYKKHVRLTHKIKSVRELKFGCKTCDIHFYTRDHLLLHRVNQNHEEVDPFVCKACGSSKATANEFRSHILEHTEEEREAANLAICLQCFKVFFSAFKLSFHMEVKHSPGKTEPNPPHAPAQGAPTPAPSELLQKKKKNKGPYLRYLRANEKFECLRCHRRFKTCETLANHVKFSHGGEKKIVRNDCSCNMCGRKFNALRRLANHMKIHSGNRPVFQCEECGQIYGKKMQVLEHIRTDHAEQVQRHQQQQQQQQEQQQQQDLLQATQTTDTLTDSTAHQPVIEVAATSSSWSPIKSPFKVPTVEQTQEAVYSLLQLTDF